MTCGWGSCQRAADWDTPLCADHLITAWSVVEANRATAGTETTTAGRPRRPARADLETLVYYIRLKHGAIKIGFTSDLGMRRRTLRVPATEVLAVEPGGRAREAVRHRQFADARVDDRLEDFTPTPALLAHIADLRAQYADPTELGSALKAANTQRAARVA